MSYCDVILVLGSLKHLFYLYARVYFISGHEQHTCALSHYYATNYATVFLRKKSEVKSGSGGDRTRDVINSVLAYLYACL